MLKLSIEKPWLIISTLLVVILACTFGAKDLYFRGDYKIFFKPEDPNRLAFEEMQGTFSKSENVGIVIAPKSNNVFTKETLSLVKQITDDFWQTPLSTRVDSITNFQHTYSLEDDLIVEDLLLELDWLGEQRIALIKEVSLNEPELLHKMISPSGHVTMVNITVRLPDGDQTAEVAEITNFVKQKLAEIEAKDDQHDFYLTGMVVMNDAAQVSAFNDAQTLFPLMFALITVLLIVLLGSFYAAIATLIIVLTSIVSTMGLAGWQGVFLSMATVNAPIIIMTLAVADCIHLVATMRLSMQKGDDKKTAIEKSLKLNTKPIIITSITTAIGFLTLNFSEVPILSDLGNLAAIGVAFACVFSLLLMPAMLTVMPIRYSQTPKQQTQSSDDDHEMWYGKLNQFCLNNYRSLVVVCLLFGGSFTYLSTTNQLNDIAIEYWDKSSEFRQDADFQEDNLSGLSNIDFGIFTNVSSGINDPEFLNTLEAFTQWLLAQEEVDHVSSMAFTYKRLNKNMNGDNPDFYRLPDNQDTAAQYLLLYEMSLPYGLDLNNQIDIEKSATRVVATLENLGSTEFTGFETRAKNWFAENAPHIRITAASPPLMFAHIGEANMEGMIKGALIALILISALLIFALKSLKLGLLSLIPNMLPAAMGFGVWSFISGEVNMALSVVISITLGIVVDDTVHFLSKYQHAKQDGLNTEQSLMFAFKNVSTALVTTTLVLALGFLVLVFSDFTLNSHMGLLTAIVISFALVIDLIFLPAFILLLEKAKNEV
jgi:predicted RND superfamily exporter protein